MPEVPSDTLIVVAGAVASAAAELGINNVVGIYPPIYDLTEYSNNQKLKVVGTLGFQTKKKISNSN